MLGRSHLRQLLVAPNELVLKFNGQYMLHMTLAGLTGDEERIIGQKTFGIVPGVELDDLTLYLVQCANIHSVLNNLTTTAKLRELLGEITFRMGRINDLKKELDRLERTFTIRYKKRDNGAFFMEVEISNGNSWSKFLVGLDLHYAYPFGDLNFTFKSLFGNVTFQAVEEAIGRIPRSFGRLTKILTTLKNI